jgi:hypothetical protein
MIEARLDVAGFLKSEQKDQGRAYGELSILCNNKGENEWKCERL